MISNPNADWLAAWQRAQQTLASVYAPASPNPASGPAEAWQRLFEGWIAAVPSGAPSGDLGSRVGDELKRMVEQTMRFWSSAGAAGAAPFPTGAPTFDAKPFLDTVGALMPSFASIGGSANPDVATAWRALIDTWTRMPTFGLHREADERRQGLLAALNQLIERQGAFGAQLQRAAERGLAEFQKAVAERAVKNEPVTTPRALYDLYVDAFENGWQAIALEPAFGDTYAQQVNAELALRARFNAEVERMVAEFNLPTRTELDAAHAKVHALNQRVIALEHAVAMQRAPAPLPEPVKRGGVPPNPRREPPRKTSPASGKPASRMKPAARSGPNFGAALAAARAPLPRGSGTKGAGR